MNIKISATALSAFLLTGSALASGHDHQGDAAPASKAKPGSSKPGTPQDPAFTKLDGNRDGFIAKSELPAKHPLRAHFDMLDKNKDGRLDAKEFQAGKSML